MQEFRFAVEADLPRLVPFVNAAYQVEKFFKIGERTHEGELAALFKTGRFLLLEEGPALLGCVYVEVSGEKGYFGMLSVAPDRQKQRIGTRLIAAAEEFCREMRCRVMELTVVNLRTELPPLYARFGYRITGERPFPAEEMPVKVPCSFLVMQKPLMQS